MPHSLYSIFTFLAFMMLAACSTKQPDKSEPVSDVHLSAVPGFVFIKGGTFINTHSNLYGKKAWISDFWMSQFEVTQKEWTQIMGKNPSAFTGDDLPVETVSWYDCVAYCNRRSVHEGLTPYYTIDTLRNDQNNRNELDNIKWTVTCNARANGYRLPTEAEWEYAAGGGQLSKSFIYSGSDSIDVVAWYWQNSGDKALSGMWSWPVIEKNHNRTQVVGKKKPNELELYDMSGNVREWCEDWYEDESVGIGMSRAWRGGGWMGADISCPASFRGEHQANGKGSDQGLRLCRNM